MKKTNLNAKLTLRKKTILSLSNINAIKGGGTNEYQTGFGISDASMCHSCASECLCPIPETQFQCPTPTNGPDMPCCPAPHTFGCTK